MTDKLNNVIKMTDKVISELKSFKKRVYYRDTIEKDLQVQITIKGIKTFYLYKRIDGVPTRLKLGRFGDVNVKKARELAAKNKVLIGEGLNPQKTRKDIREEDTLDTMFKKFLVHKKGKVSSTTFEEYKRMWKKDLGPLLAKRKVSQITIVLLRHIHKKFEDKPYYANRCIAFIRGMFNFFIKEGIYKGENPARSVYMNKEEPRVRYLEQAEVERFFTAINEIGESVSKNAILLMLFTGARKSNVLCMKWNELDLDSKIWMIPKTKTSKNITLALADSAVELLKEIKNNSESEFVFPSIASKTGHIVEVKRVWATIKKKANLNNLRLHDLRHTLATYMIAQGANPFIVQRALSHKSIKSTQVYVNIGVEHLRDKINETVNVFEKLGKCKK